MSTAASPLLASSAIPTGPTWTSPELLARSSWRRKVPAAVADEFLRHLVAAPETTVDGFTWRPEQLPELAAFGASARRELDEGDGVLLISGLGELDLDPEDLRCFYYAIGCALGQPMLQYGRVYPVYDRGACHKSQAVPVSMTSAETCFHTDSSSVDAVPDLVGLLCEQPSERGGDSLISNANNAYRSMRRHAPELLARLQRPMIRNVVTPGRERNRDNLLQNRFPIFQAGERGLLFRYMRYWIEVGQREAGMPLDATDVAALDLLDELLAADDNVVQFRLERGDVLWVDNRVLAHNRTAYVDTPSNLRRLQRMWIGPRRADGAHGGTVAGSGA